MTLPRSHFVARNSGEMGRAILDAGQADQLLAVFIAITRQHRLHPSFQALRAGSPTVEKSRQTL
jgi:hypothetical protein